MCIYIENINNSLREKRKVAKTDITCYKITVGMDFRPNYRGYTHPAQVDVEGEKLYLLTPYQKYGVVFNETLSIEKYAKVDYDLIQYRNCALVYGGCFHSFQKLEDAICHTDFMIKPVFERYVIVRCVIPKGTPYYEGQFDNDMGELVYGSRKIRYEEIVKVID